MSGIIEAIDAGASIIDREADEHDARAEAIATAQTAVDNLRALYQALRDVDEHVSETPRDLFPPMLWADMTDAARTCVGLRDAVALLLDAASARLVALEGAS